MGETRAVFKIRERFISKKNVVMSLFNTSFFLLECVFNIYSKSIYAMKTLYVYSFSRFIILLHGAMYPIGLFGNRKDMVIDVIAMRFHWLLSGYNHIQRFWV